MGGYIPPGGPLCGLRMPIYGTFTNRKVHQQELRFNNIAINGRIVSILEENDRSKRNFANFWLFLIQIKGKDEKYALIKFDLP
jgi:hypothetical protein